MRKFTAGLALFSAVGVGLSAQTPAAPATPPTSDEAVRMDAFVTTGSRFGTAASQADIPITVIGKPQIDQTAVVEVADYLKNLPAFTGAGNTNDTSTNGGTGGRFIDLRGLGSQYTLVMINGRRLAYQGTSNLVDVNQVPVSAVDHVEVLTSGASAVYGTEAIGGVVNIITKKGINGGELDAYYGDVKGKTNLGRRQFAFSLNASNDKVDVMVGGQYFKQNGIYSSDFPWSTAPGPTSNTYPYRLTLPNSLFTAGATGTSNYVVKWKPGEGGRRDATKPSDFRVYNGKLPNVDNPDAGGDQFPFYLYTPLIRPEERHNFFAFTDFKLTDTVKANVDIMYRYSYSYNQLAPAAVPVPALGAIIIPKTNYYNQQIFGANAVDITRGGWRLLGLGPRLDTAETTGIWVNGGLSGKVADWDWKVQTMYTQEMNQFMSGNTTSVDLINQWLNMTTPDAFNPFSSNLNANAPIWGQIRRNAYVNDRSRLGNAEASANGKVFDLPAGPVKAAFAVEWNKLQAYDHPDALTQATPLGFNGTPNPTDGSRTQWGVSAEADVPLLTSLSTRVAGRHDNYSDFGGVNVGQVSARFQPTKELLFRGSFGQGFLAPSLLELHEGPQVTNPQFLDPSANNGDGTWGTNSQVSLTRVGNPNLKPEKADMFNLGVAYSPKGLNGLTLTVDYWKVKQTDVVSSADDYARIIAKRFWESLGSSDAARDAAARNPATLATAVASIKAQTGVTVLWEPDGGPAGLGGLSQSGIAESGVYRTNLAGTKTDGFDLGATYQWDSHSFGRFALDLKATYTKKFDYQALVGDEWQHLGGEYGTGFEGIWPKWRTNAVLDWRWKGIGAVATWRHVDHVKIDAGMDDIYGRDYLPSWDVWDFQASYRIPVSKTDIAIGVENAFNRPPPQTSYALNNFVPGGAYDVKGTFYYVRLQQKF